MTILTWERLRILGASRIMSLAALMPFLGFIIILNQYAVDLVNWLGTPLEISDHSNHGFPNVKLFSLYYGAVLLGVGKILFNINCPPEITQYVNKDDYIEKKERLKTEREYKILMDIVSKHGELYQQEAEMLFNCDHRNGKFDSTGEGYRTLLGLHWDYLDGSNHKEERW
jgi:hypothetical protein